ncbi:MAG: AmmeMemoRadiSam system protein B [wastewater metagenome]|nr:AmmeMemoRadiSam system protein B [Candidatus Loosdrechtia aerotolerans]
MGRFLFFITFFVIVISKTTFTTDILSAQTRSATVQVSQQEVWDSQAAGRFYPGDENALKDQIHTFLKNVTPPSRKGKPMAIVSPHSGYQYSGQVAAYGYNAIKDHDFNRVIILSASHFMSGKRFRGVSILNVKAVKTPLGLIPVDQEACNTLLNTSRNVTKNLSSREIALFGSYDDAYQGEHSLETQLPFLQMTLGDFKLIPILVGILIGNDFDQIAHALQPFIDDKTLIVVSSDFTHYGNGFGYVPFKNDVEKNIKHLDYGAFEKILSKDFEGLKMYRKTTGINACGIIPIALLLKLLPQDAQGEVLNYDTSGHKMKNFSFSVSYASILFTKPTETQ